MLSAETALSSAPAPRPKPAPTRSESRRPASIEGDKARIPHNVLGNVVLLRELSDLPHRLELGDVINLLLKLLRIAGVVKRLQLPLDPSFAAVILHCGESGRK